jgi:hypothetical protein
VWVFGAHAPVQVARSVDDIVEHGFETREQVVFPFVDCLCVLIGMASTARVGLGHLLSSKPCEQLGRNKRRVTRYS